MLTLLTPVIRRDRLPIAPASAAAGPHVRTRMRSLQTEAPLRTVFRDTFRSRAISLIVLPLMKCSRRIRAIVSTISIPNHLLHYKAGSATDQPVGGQFWTPIPRLRGSILQAEPHFTFCSIGRCSHVFGLLNAVQMTAGHNALRGSGPDKQLAFKNALAKL